MKSSKKAFSKGSSPEMLTLLSVYLSPSLTTKVIKSSSRSSLMDTCDESIANCRYPLSL